MKKITSILLVVCLLGALCACGAAAEPEPSAVTDEIIASLSIASPLNVPAERLLALYGIAVIVKAVDPAAAGRVEARLNARLDSVMGQAQNYDPESFAIAQQCRVQKNGNYVALFISPQHEAMEQIFDKAFQ